MTQPTNTENAEHLALVRKLRDWLDAAGIQGGDIPVDLADTLAAAREIEAELRELLRTDVRDTAQADVALQHLGRIHAWLFGELKPHLAGLEKAWPQLEERLLQLAPED